MHPIGVIQAAERDHAGIQSVSRPSCFGYAAQSTEPVTPYPLVINAVKSSNSNVQLQIMTIALPRHASSYTTLLCLNRAISSELNPNSASTSSVCSPNSGGRAAILLGVRESVKG
jgi:hypothetical protein